MSFDLSNDYGRAEKYQFECLERLSVSFEFTIRLLDETIQGTDKRLAKGDYMGSLSKELEFLNILKKDREALASLYSRTENLSRDLNRFYNRSQKARDEWLRESRSV